MTFSRSSQLRVFLSAFAALAVLCAQTARGDLADAGVSATDAGVVTVDAGAVDAAAVGDAGRDAPPPGELAMPPELAPPTTSATLTTTTPLVDTPTPAEAEPPRPITRRLWFWMAITGLVITGVAIGIAVQSPTVNRPGCPAGYVCPL